MDIVKVATVSIIPVLLFLILCWLLIRQNQGREHAGQLLLSLSIPRSRRFALILIGTLQIVAAGFIQELFPNGDDIVMSIVRGALIGGGIGCWMGSFSTTEIREEGIWIAGKMIPWSLIRSYQWTANRQQNLVVNLSKRIGLQNTIKLLVEPRHQQSLEQIFQQKLTIG